MDMVVTEVDAGALRVALTGRMDAQGAEAIEPSFTGRVAKSGRNVMIDLSESERDPFAMQL